MAVYYKYALTKGNMQQMGKVCDPRVIKCGVKGGSQEMAMTIVQWQEVY